MPLTPRKIPTWVVAIVVVLVLQTVTATMGRLVPVAAPAFTVEFGWDQSWVGYLSAATIVGALFTLTAGIGIMHRLGGVRALQLSLLFGAASLMLYLVPSIGLALTASICVGLGSGTANPAGSEVLQRFTPPQHRNLMFSVKQAGVPVGGMFGGLVIPPLIEAMGWRLAAVVIAAGCIAVIMLTWPFQKMIDPPPEERVQRRLVSLRLTDILVPIRSLTTGHHLLRASFCGAMLAVPQSGWITFSVTYLVVALGQSLSAAGLFFAVMQASSMFGRLFLGWFADRTSGKTTLMIASLGSTVATVALGLSSSTWPAWAFMLLAAFSGFVVSGWNGVQIAEIARRSPPELIGETAAGGVLFIFVTNLITPVVFAAFVHSTSRYDIAFLATAGSSLACMPLLLSLDRARSKLSI